MIRISLSVEGYNPEKLLKLAEKRGIAVYRLKRISKKLVELQTKRKDFARIVDLAKELCYNVNEIQPSGIYGILKHFRFYPLIPILCVVLFLLLTYTSRFCADIRIDSGGIVEDSKVMAALSEMNIKRGIALESIDLDAIENRLNVRFTECEYVLADIDGRILFVTLIPGKFNQHEPITPRDIIADRDGIVTRVVALRGTRLVNVGDTVSKGQVLISGLVEYADGTDDYLRADGEVYAQAVSTGETVYTPYKNVLVRTGRTLRFMATELFGRRIGTLPIIPFVQYEHTSTKHILVPMPLILYNVTVYEQRNEILEVSFEEARSELEDRSLELALENADFEVESVTYETIETPEITVRAIAKGTALISVGKEYNE